MRVTRGVITLYFDPTSYAQEMGDGSELTSEEIERIGKRVNDEVAASFYGYEGWNAECKQIEVTNEGFKP
jgi:hypothetical protein